MKSKTKIINILFGSMIVCLSSNAFAKCDTPLACYEKAIESIKQQNEYVKNQVAILERSNKELKEELENKIYLLKDSVIGFESNKCPKGWEEYKPAYGRFIRGLDRSGKNIDPEASKRKFGKPQDDMLKDHKHTITGGQGGHGGRFRAYDGNASGMITNKTEKTIPGGAETRPKNVALLFCRMK